MGVVDTVAVLEVQAAYGFASLAGRGGESKTSPITQQPVKKGRFVTQSVQHPVPAQITQAIIEHRQGTEKQ